MYYMVSIMFVFISFLSHSSSKRVPEKIIGQTFRFKGAFMKTYDTNLNE